MSFTYINSVFKNWCRKIWLKTSS